jgi:hypothetical protein
MVHDDLVARLWCKIPSRALLDLSAAGWHTTSSGTRCNVADQTLIRRCEANHLPPTVPLPQKRLVGEWPWSLSRMCSCPGVGGVAGVTPHVVLGHQLLTGGRGGAGGGGLPCGACPRPRPWPVDPSRMSITASLVALVHAICHK